MEAVERHRSSLNGDVQFQIGEDNGDENPDEGIDPIALEEEVLAHAKLRPPTPRITPKTTLVATIIF
jgi:hypothetical protein